MEIIKLKQFQNDFNTAIEKSLNQKLDIETEIKEVLDFVNTIPKQRAFSKPVKSEFETIRNTRIFIIPICDRRLLSDAFYSIKETGKFNDLIQTANDTELTNQFKENTVKQAFELFEYYKWLNESLSPQKSEKKNEFSHKQIILALHYLGFDMKQFNQVKTGLILGEILGLDSKNTTDYIRHVSSGKNNVRTSENLKKVKQLFEKHGLNEVSETINPEKPRE